MESTLGCRTGERDYGEGLLPQEDEPVLARGVAVGEADRQLGPHFTQRPGHREAVAPLERHDAAVHGVGPGSLDLADRRAGRPIGDPRVEYAVRAERDDPTGDRFGRI